MAVTRSVLCFGLILVFFVLQRGVFGLVIFPGCQAPFVQLSGRCYFFSCMQKSWSHAQAYCRSISSHLARITSQSENNMIVSYVRNYFSVNFSWWLGGNDMAQEGRWVWVGTNSVLSYTNWYPGEPSNNEGIEHCLELRSVITHRWNDAPCGHAKNFICEK
ncbi:perlucin-like [Lingula anatina]|uniref:Perlucin-like n=1 Tax=Lingula anatina TaxID=7574 RepID=A0A1S3IWF2_LINAN|nr:perlucin-like [Lingula anatina]|eukprot:XP_013402517.1 perlucin-like [Lingula anatina]